MNKWLAIAVSVIAVCAVVAFAIYTYSGKQRERRRARGRSGGRKTEPVDRPKEAVLNDIRNGYVSRERAEKIYSTVLK